MKTQNIANRAHLKRLINKGLIEARRKYRYTEDYAYDNKSSFGEMKEWATARMEDEANKVVDGVAFSEWDLNTKSGAISKEGDNLWRLRIHSNEVWEIRFKQSEPAPDPEPVVEKSPQLAEVTLHYSRKMSDDEMHRVTGSRDSYSVLHPLFADCIDYREKFCILLVNRANRVVGWHLVSIGGVAGTVADPKIVMQAAILANASGIILAHNHPSGNLTPSQDDIDLTRKIKEGAKLLEIQVLDHLILAGQKYFSFADEGMI